MRKSFLLLFSLVLLALALPAQKVDQAKKTEILEEGYLMFRLELASWQATDRLRDFLAQASERNLVGYLTYPDGDSLRTIYYSGDELVKILATVSFDGDGSPGSLTVDRTERYPNKTELLHIQLREAAMENARNDEERFYTIYEHTGMNLVVLPGEEEHKVYFMTAPQLEGVILMGNDYLLKFDADLNLLSREKLHGELIQMNAENAGDENSTRVTAHEHGKGAPAYITATDICTLLLYSQMTDWVAHQVLSPKMVSIWDIESEQLLILTRKAFNKIAKEQAGK